MSAPSPCIFFSVPKPFLDSFERFYIPDLISIGPHHSGMLNPESMATHKSEAERRMEFRIQSKCPGSTLEAIVENEIMAMEKSIRECYDKEILASPQELARMVTTDACFIYEFLLSYFKYVHVEDICEPIPQTKYDSILDACCMNPTWERILFNLLLFENQIPLSVLELLVGKVPHAKKEILDRRLDIRRFTRDPLEIFHYYLLETLISRESYCVFDWFIPPPPPAIEDKRHLLNVFYMAYVGGTHTVDCNGDGVGLPKVPTAKLLKQKGVQFKASVKKIGHPITTVVFEEKTSTLQLPQVHVDAFRIGLIRNFIALEVTNNEYNPFPMTSFAMFMNELIHDGEDCRLLCESGIIVNMLGSDEEVANAFNSITQGLRVRASTCQSIDNARKGLHNYLRKWHRFYSSEVKWLMCCSCFKSVK